MIFTVQTWYYVRTFGVFIRMLMGVAIRHRMHILPQNLYCQECVPLQKEHHGFIWLFMLRCDHDDGSSHPHIVQRSMMMSGRFGSANYFYGCGSKYIRRNHRLQHTGKWSQHISSYLFEVDRAYHVCCWPPCIQMNAAMQTANVQQLQAVVHAVFSTRFDAVFARKEREQLWCHPAVGRSVVQATIVNYQLGDEPPDQPLEIINHQETITISISIRWLIICRQPSSTSNQQQALEMINHQLLI